MTLASGTRLGPYEILAPLGAGGMGEVYRARDTKLDRDVAVKVLPGKLAADPDALARFEREAKTVAALSHPNLLGIYDFGSHGGVTYAVAELLSGETLRDRISAGTIPQRKAIDYVLQMARGLAAAHDKGIVHRDLKPENVFVTNDGRVKILDFGLAKASPIESFESGAATFGGTEPGTVLGTVGYMSPEQVRGRPADSRSDIFSFGAILYEMLSGRRAFKGDSAIETMNAILTRDLPEPSGATETLPPLLDRIVRHCLEKNPEERFQSIRDVAFDLETASTATSSSTRALLAPIATKPRWIVPAAVLGAAALVALAWFAGRVAAGKGGASAAPRFFFAQQTDQQGVEMFPSLSPDGKTLVYTSGASGNDDIYLERVGGQNPINLTKDSPENDTHPAFSPDGSSIAFSSERSGGGIFVMGASGESARRLTDGGGNPAWSPDGKQIAYASEPTWQPLEKSGISQLWIVDIPSGQKRLVFEGDGMQPAWSPNGHRIAFWGIPPGSGQRDVWTIPAGGLKEGEQPLAVTADLAVDWNPVWSPDGGFLYFASDRGGGLNLWRVPIEEASGKTLGEPEPVTLPTLWAGHFSLSRDGKAIAYFAFSELSSLQKIPFDPSSEKAGQPISLLSGSRSIQSPNVSPDGEWVVFRSRGQREDLSIVRSDGTGLRQLTDDPHRDRGPNWSPDGKSIAFYSNRSGNRYEIWAIRPDGSGLRQLTRTTGGSLWFPYWSPDGKRLAIPGGTNSSLYDIGSPLGTDPTPLTQFPDESRWFWVTSWSPDGRLLAGRAVRRGFPLGNLTLYELEGRRYRDLKTDRELTPTTSGPVWLPDSRRMIYMDRREVMLIDVETGRTRVLLGGIDPAGIGSDLDVSDDGRWIYFVATNSEGDIWLASAP